MEGFVAARELLRKQRIVRSRLTAECDGCSGIGVFNEDVPDTGQGVVRGADQAGIFERRRTRAIERADLLGYRFG